MVALSPLTPYNFTTFQNQKIHLLSVLSINYKSLSFLYKSLQISNFSSPLHSTRHISNSSILTNFLHTPRLNHLHFFMAHSTNDGASFSEQLLECARRNNTELLQSIIAELPDVHAVAKLVNSTKEVISNNSPLHIATLLGNWEFIDMVLDIEGVEIDPLNRDGDTPLHLAVKYAASEPEYGYFIIDNLLDAGLDAKIVDRSGLKPVNYVVNNEKLRTLLQSAEYAAAVEEVEVDDDDDDEGDEGLASDSD